MRYTIVFEPSGTQLICDEPLIVAEAAARMGVYLRVDCGRKGVCGKCRVRLCGSNPPNPSEADKQHLSATQLTDGWRLACRTMVETDVTVEIPESSLTSDRLVPFLGSSGCFPTNPSVKVLSLELNPPSLDDQTADLDRVSLETAREHGVQIRGIGLPTLTALRNGMREGNWRVTIAVNGGEIIAAHPGKVSHSMGIAVDVGTTKLACYLVDLEKGLISSVAGVTNPQIAYGEDVMSRLEAASSQPQNKLRLQQGVVEAVNNMVVDLCQAQGMPSSHIHDACLVGNTAMHHLLLGLPVKPLGLAPFTSATGLALYPAARDIGLELASGAKMYIPPPIAGFVGSDHVAFLLATGFGSSSGTRLGLDIGTNTEIALEVNGRIVCCSAASGPAFEGAHVSQGMRAAPGAIEHVTIDGDFEVNCDVIGDVPPVGICGTGVLDALAEMYHAGIINRRGHIQGEFKGVIRESDDTLSFLLSSAGDGRQGVTITQKDIVQVLLAKGAIRAGIEILMAHHGVSPQEIDDVIIAGAFGTCLDPINAVKIGLLPDVPAERIRAVGNAAGTGACMMLVSEDARRRAESLSRRVEYLELTLHPMFTRSFVEGTRMPWSEEH